MRYTFYLSLLTTLTYCAQNSSDSNSIKSSVSYESFDENFGTFDQLEGASEYKREDSYEDATEEDRNQTFCPRNLSVAELKEEEQRQIYKSKMPQLVKDLNFLVLSLANSKPNSPHIDYNMAKIKRSFLDKISDASLIAEFEKLVDKYSKMMRTLKGINALHNALHIQITKKSEQIIITVEVSFVNDLVSLSDVSKELSKSTTLSHKLCMIGDYFNDNIDDKSKNGKSHLHFNSLNSVFECLIDIFKHEMTKSLHEKLEKFKLRLMNYSIAKRLNREFESAPLICSLADKPPQKVVKRRRKNAEISRGVKPRICVKKETNSNGIYDENSASGIEDELKKPFIPLEEEIEIRNQLEKRALDEANRLPSLSDENIVPLLRLKDYLLASKQIPKRKDDSEATKIAGLYESYQKIIYGLIYPLNIIYHDAVKANEQERKNQKEAIKPSQKFRTIPCEFHLLPKYLNQSKNFYVKLICIGEFIMKDRKNRFPSEMAKLIECLKHLYSDMMTEELKDHLEKFETFQFSQNFGKKVVKKAADAFYKKTRAELLKFLLHDAEWMYSSSDKIFKSSLPLLKKFRNDVFKKVEENQFQHIESNLLTLLTNYESRFVALRILNNCYSTIMDDDAEKLEASVEDCLIKSNLRSIKEDLRASKNLPVKLSKIIDFLMSRDIGDKTLQALGVIIRCWKKIYLMDYHKLESHAKINGSEMKDNFLTKFYVIWSEKFKDEKMGRAGKFEIFLDALDSVAALLLSSVVTGRISKETDEIFQAISSRWNQQASNYMLDMAQDALEREKLAQAKESFFDETDFCLQLFYAEKQMNDLKRNKWNSSSEDRLNILSPIPAALLERQQVFFTFKNYLRLILEYLDFCSVEANDAKCLVSAEYLTFLIGAIEKYQEFHSLDLLNALKRHLEQKKWTMVD